MSKKVIFKGNVEGDINARALVACVEEANYVAKDYLVTLECSNNENKFEVVAVGEDTNIEEFLCKFELKEAICSSIA